MDVIENTIEKFSYLQNSDFFETIDTEIEYDRRVLFQYLKLDNDTAIEASIYIPIEGTEYDFDWKYEVYKRLDDMFYRINSIRFIEDTEDWFKDVAKDIDIKCRINRTLK
jgi:hypothetical protein